MGRTIVRIGGSDRIRSRLFCFPHAGSGASIYYSWRRLLPKEVELCVIQLPGREERAFELPHRSLEGAICDVQDSMAALLDVPCLFFGHSMGAVVAFEVARRLKEAGPGHLILSAAQPPHLPQSRTPIGHLADEAFITALQRRTNGLPREILADREALSVYVNLLKADFSASEQYTSQPCPAVGGSITAVGGRSDPVVGRAVLEAWSQQTAGRFELRLFEGDHFYFLNNPSLLVSFIVNQMVDQGLCGALGQVRA